MIPRARPVQGRRLAAFCAALLVWFAEPAAAQRVNTLVAPIRSRPLLDPKPLGPSPVGAFLASAVLPGAGQYRLGAGRWIAYAGVEGWAWINWSDARSEAADLEGEYRDLAWAVARRIGTGDRREREFEYYEAMSNFAESGSFDSNPAVGGVQPEEDASTFNGSVWSLARAIFYPGGGDSIPPSAGEEAAALAYYESHAIAQGFAWSWGSNLLEQEHFRNLIRQSDEAARESTTILGVILVNHVVSAIDAMISARLRGRGFESPLRLRSETFRGPLGPGNYLVVEIPVP